MATQLQIRRGTTAQMGAFTGAEGELAVNTSTDTVHVHDGATAGGFALAKADGSNIGTYAGSFTTLAASGASTLTGAVGINIAPTSYKLTVNSGATTETTAAAIGYNGDAGTNLYINTDHGNNLVSLYASGSSSKEMRFLSGTLEVMRLATTGNVEMRGSANVRISLGTAGTSGANNNSNWIYGNGTNLRFNNAGGFYSWETLGTERARIDTSGMLAVPQWHIQTTALGATAYVASGPQGAIYRSTSSIKYKRDVETIEDIYADAVLDVRPVFYRSKSDNDNSAHGFWGIIAEELAEIDPRLVHWQTHVPVEVTDDDGVVTTEMVELDTPEAEGVQYERFVPLLLNLAKRQRDQITAQTAAITDLTTRLTALENNL